MANHYDHPTEDYVSPQERKSKRTPPSWYCDRCQAEIYSLRCKYCGKSEEEKA